MKTEFFTLIILPKDVGNTFGEIKEYVKHIVKPYLLEGGNGKIYYYILAWSHNEERYFAKNLVEVSEIKAAFSSIIPPDGRWYDFETNEEIFNMYKNYLGHLATGIYCVF